MTEVKTHWELELEIGYDYQPFEKTIIHPAPGDPGCPEGATPYSILFRGIELIEKFTNEELEEIEQEILERRDRG